MLRFHKSKIQNPKSRHIPPTLTNDHFIFVISDHFCHSRCPNCHPHHVYHDRSPFRPWYPCSIPYDNSGSILPIRERKA
ncbi:hypothetical protein [Rubritalea tangerina]|uniref:hypothetical protein n=1 Tax=Rubritalea tangerina TaxID=430798 RepID=UPI0036128B0A